MGEVLRPFLEVRKGVGCRILWAHLSGWWYAVVSNLCRGDLPLRAPALGCPGKEAAP